MKFISCSWPRNRKPFKGCRHTQAQRFIAFHHSCNGRHSIIISRRHRQACHVVVGSELVKIAAHRVSHHHRLRGFVNTLAQKQLTVSVLLQQFSGGFRFQFQRADHCFLLIFRMKRHKFCLAFGKQRLKVRHIHNLRCRQLRKVNHCHSLLLLIRKGTQAHRYSAARSAPPPLNRQNCC
ncbi:Uncharacterised protein [Escherichia coli]|nr:Uncharacterised protein [Escherichia coli]